MVEGNIIDIIKQLGQCMEATEDFFISFIGGYTLIIIGISVIGIMSAIFYYVMKTKDWAVST